jgi:predicted PurR-regulated permease PerM
MSEAIFLLGLSFLLVVICLTILLLTAVPAFQELAKAANSIIRLADTLTRELPATLEAIRLTGLELSELSDELNQGAKNAGEAVKQVNDGIKGVKQSASSATIATKSALAGLKAGLKSLGRPRNQRRTDPYRENLRSNNQSIRDLDASRDDEDID